jgi:hypothetical protein
MPNIDLSHQVNVSLTRAMWPPILTGKITVSCPPGTEGEALRGLCRWLGIVVETGQDGVITVAVGDA